MYSFYVSLVLFIVTTIYGQRRYPFSNFLKRCKVSRSGLVLYCGVLSCYAMCALVTLAQINLPRMTVDRTFNLEAMPVVDSSKGTFVVDRRMDTEAGFYINVSNSDGTTWLKHISEGENVELHEASDSKSAGIWKRTYTVHDCSTWVAKWALWCQLDEDVLNNELYVPSNTVAHQFVLRETYHSRD